MRYEHAARPLYTYGVLFLLCWLLTACVNTTDVYSLGGVDRANVQLDADVPVLIVNPVFENAAQDQGHTLSNVIETLVNATFSKYARLVDNDPAPHASPAEMLSYAAHNGYGYVIVTKVTTWKFMENYPDEQSTEINITITVLDAKTSKVLSNEVLTGSRMKSLLGFDTETKKPEELLAPILRGYVRKLYDAPSLLPV